MPFSSQSPRNRHSTARTPVSGLPDAPQYTSYDTSPASTRNNSITGLSSETSQASFHIQEPRRRLTTITLREIRYPFGCPCHPEEPMNSKNAKKSNSAHTQSPGELYRVSSWDRELNRWTPHARPELVRRTESHTSTGSRNSSTSSASSNLNTDATTPSRPRGLSRLFSRMGN